MNLPLKSQTDRLMKGCQKGDQKRERKLPLNRLPSPLVVVVFLMYTNQSHKRWKERVFSSWIVCGFYKIYNLNFFMVLTIVSVIVPFRLIFSWRCTKIFGQRIPILFPSKSIRCRNFEIFPTLQSFVYFSTFPNSAKDKSIAITQYCT